MSQTDKILKHLKTGKTLTPLAALEKYGCFRLAARIEELRKAGHKIETRRINRKGKSYAGYKLA